jgi:nucleotide-binding universal stress UspA family protein
MLTAGAETKIGLKNILYLTDFSEPSEVALPFATTIARAYGAKVYALHVFMPTPLPYTTPEATIGALEAEEESAKLAMRRVESQLAGLAHETLIERGMGVWEAVQQAMEAERIDLIVLGTHGRTGAEKFLLGSVAEEIFRRSAAPVLTIGPGVRTSVHTAGRFHRVLFASDFTPESQAAAPFAASLARESDARLVLVHVMRESEQRNEREKKGFELSVAEAIHQLYETLPKNVGLSFPPEVAIEFGAPADRIVEAAKQRGADLIVLGVRDATGRLGAATHLGRAIAHQVVAHAPCPVLTVRG